MLKKMEQETGFEPATLRLATDENISDIYNSGVPFDIRQTAIESNFPASYYRFEPETFAPYLWENGPNVHGGVVENYIHDINGRRERENLDMKTDLIWKGENLTREIP